MYKKADSLFFNPVNTLPMPGLIIILMMAFVLLCAANSLSAQQSSKLLTSSMTPYYINSGNAVQNESVKNIIDRNVNTKFIDAGKSNTGFFVNTQIDSRVTKIELTTADDNPENDPSAFTLFGSNDGNEWTAIYSNNIPCNSARLNMLGFTFTNFDIYSWYKVEFSGLCNAASAKAMQIAEVQLYRSSITLPIKLISFEGQVSGQQVNLFWKLSQPEENALFEIQKSHDGFIFTPLKIMPKNAIATQFSHADRLYSNGTFYYRLKMTEITGEITYSNIVALKAGNENSISIFPNPTVGSKIIHASILGNKINGWVLINSAGQQLAENRKVILTGNAEIALPATLKPGIYYLQFQAESGPMVQKLVIN